MEPWKYDKTMNKLLKFFRSVDNGKKKGKCEYTDDTAMLRCVANSLVQHEELDARDLSIRFTEEYFREPNRGYGGDIHTVFEQLRDTNFSDPFGPAATQFDGKGSFGNGGAMRIAPAALFGLHFSEMDFNSKIEQIGASLSMMLAGNFKFKLHCPSGYPNYTEQFCIPEADPAIKLWANAINEFLLDSQQKFSLRQILNKAASLHRKDQVHSHSNSEGKLNNRCQIGLSYQQRVHDDYGTYKIDVKTKIASDMELLTSGSDHHDTGMVTGDMQLKSTVWKDIGLSWSTKWSLENMVSAEVVVEDKLLQGLKLSCDGHFVPLTGKKNATVRAVYKNSSMHTSIDADVAGPNVSGLIVLGHKGWLAGCLLSYDTCRSAMTNFNMAAARTMEDYTIYLAFNNSTQFQSSIYHKVNDKLEFGIKKGWSTDNTDTKFSVAAKYSVDKDLILRGKLNNRCQIGLSYQQRVHDAQNLVMNSNNNNDSDSDETDEWECCCCTTANSNADEKCSQCETSRYANLVQPPENWDIPNNGERVSLVTLRTDEAEHQTITCNLESTKTKFSVCQIDRVQNIYLHNLYATMKQHMESDSRRPAIFERTLYHGTDLNSMKNIISEGFDRNLAGRNSTALGRGTYFSVDPGYAMDRQYATPNSDGLQCMLRCSVLTGSFTKGSSQLLQPPKDRNGRVYDSVTERKKNPQMFAVFRDNQAYVGHVIYFRMR